MNIIRESSVDEQMTGTAIVAFQVFAPCEVPAAFHASFVSCIQAGPACFCWSLEMPQAP